MNKLLLYINYSMILFFILITIYATYDTLNTYNKYGCSYEVTTIIEGKNSTRTVTIWEKIVSVILYFSLVVILILDTMNIVSLKHEIITIP